MANYSIAHLIVITGGYPSAARPTHTPFVRQFAHAIARQGVRCTVIQPVAINKSIRTGGYPYSEIEQLPGGESVTVFRPRFFSLSSRRGLERLGFLNPGLLTLHSFTKAIERVIRQKSLEPDAMYGHFLYLAGAAAVQVGKKLGIPSFPGMGESVATGNSIWTLEKFTLNQSKKLFSDLPGLIVNSSLLKRMTIQQLGIGKEKIGVFPNGVDRHVFFPRGKEEMRKKYGLPMDKFLLACTGHYSHRKGQDRIIEAGSGLKNIGFVFIGGNVPASSNPPIYFNASVSPERVVELLSACDIFILPTLGEGSSNAIIEAMACGLPIISSKGTFNDDLLEEEMSIRVDPINIDEIRKAVVKVLENSQMQGRMAAAALERAKRFNIDDRANHILEFMTKKINRT